MSKIITISLILILSFSICNNLLAQEQNRGLSSVSGTIEEINTDNKSFIISTRNKVDKTILTNSKTSFSKNMVTVKFNDFKVGDAILVSTENNTLDEIIAVGVFDEQTAFLLATGQGVAVEYSGTVHEIKGNKVTVITNDGKKELNITSGTRVMKDLKPVPLSAFRSGDKFYAKASFPGFVEHEPEIIEPAYFLDPLSYVNDLFVTSHGPMVLRGVVTEVLKEKFTFKIGKEKVLANNRTVMLVPQSFKGLNSLKGKAVMIYSITQPMPGRTYIAGAVFVEEALPVILDSLARTDSSSDEIKTLGEGKIVDINKAKKTAIIENNKKKQLLLNLMSCKIVDKSDPARKAIPLDFLRVGDTVSVEGYDIARITVVYIKEKKDVSVSRNQADINVYFFTDLLGYLNPFVTGGPNAYTFLPEKQRKENTSFAEAGGFSYLVSTYKKLSASTKNNLLLCGGNFLYGTPLCDATKGEAVIDCLNAAGVKAAVLGEQDFLVGQEQLGKLIKKATFPVLGANVIVQGTDNLFPGLKPYIIIDNNGFKMAVLGLVDSETPKLIPGEYVKGLSFTDPKVTLAKYYSALESSSDAIVIMANQRFYDNMLIASDFENIIPGKHKKPVFIIGGDVRSYSASADPLNVNDILILEAGTKGRFLGHINMGFMKDVPSVNYSYEMKQISPALIQEGDKDIRNLLDGFNDRLPAKYSEVLGTADNYFPRLRDKESVLGDFITDVMLKKSGADVAFYNGRNLRNDLFKGDITFSHLYTVIPYDFNMTVLEMTGKDIKALMEQSLASEDILQVSGMKILYKKDSPSGEKIIKLTIGDRPVSDSLLYKVATSSFLAEGGEGYTLFTGGKLLQKSGVIRDLIADYIKEVKDIKQGAGERIVTE
ncbi:MAG: bifunctional UDP-sugar hydrolase/5'-nucleotidase [Candidatus Eremiobacterota bacterium]